MSSNKRVANVIRLDERRAKYLAPATPTDPFLADAAVSARILAAAVKLPEVRHGDLRVLLARLHASLALYIGTDPMAAKLRREAETLDALTRQRGQYPQSGGGPE